MKEKTLVEQIYTSFEEVTDAYNIVRDDLMALGLRRDLHALHQAQGKDAEEVCREARN